MITGLLDPKRIALLTGAALLAVLLTLSYFIYRSGPAPLTAEFPLHLEEHLDAATIEGSEVPADVASVVEWSFDEPQPDWKPIVPLQPSVKPVRTRRIGDALRISMTEASRGPGTQAHGSIYINLPDWRREDWAYILVRARTSDKVHHLEVEYNLRKRPGPQGQNWPFLFGGEEILVINDGSVQTYLLRADWSFQKWEGPWQQLGITVAFEEPGDFDFLSVSLVPKEANYAAASVGVNMEARGKIHRHVLYSHAPGTLKYRVQVPEAGHLDVGLGVLREDVPVTFRITAQQDGGKAETLLEETYADQERWAQRSLDLSNMAGKTVTLALGADAKRPGTVALWASPTLTGKRVVGKPNIIFYVIDGGGADFMSVYGYNRRTTPNLERIAAEGAVFEHAYTNSTWTKPSTASFMTSLHHSVLGGYKNDSDPLPDQAVTMAQHLRQAGYQTAVIVSNPFAATMSGLDRGVDVLREAGMQPHSASSKELHEDFWRWREAYPGEPFWVHFQTTDVHWRHRPEAPFAGLFSSFELRETYHEWDRQLRAESGPFLTRFEKTGISREAYADAQRRLYDETMAHNDYQLGQLVEHLKARGEWNHTLLIVAADHGYVAGGWRVLDPLAPSWAPNFNSHMTRVPLIMVWPEHIAPGQRFSYPVSMIDVLPTVLDLAGLPEPEVMQGQSLASLLLGKEGWEPRPVILDEFNVDRLTGELRGSIEMIDGRWGASLEINPKPEDEEREDKEQKAEDRRPAPLLLYDLWNDPYTLHSLHEERLDLAQKYTRFLEAQWEEHQALAKRFTRTTGLPLTPEQLETLRSLGYVQ